MTMSFFLTMMPLFQTSASNYWHWTGRFNQGNCRWGSCCGIPFAADVNYLNLTADHITGTSTASLPLLLGWGKLSLHSNPGLMPDFSKVLIPACWWVCWSRWSISPTRSKTTNSLSAATMPTSSWMILLFHQPWWQCCFLCLWFLQFFKASVLPTLVLEFYFVGLLSFFNADPDRMTSFWKPGHVCFSVSGIFYGLQQCWTFFLRPTRVMSSWSRNGRNCLQWKFWRR